MIERVSVSAMRARTARPLLLSLVAVSLAAGACSSSEEPVTASSVAVDDTTAGSSPAGTASDGTTTTTPAPAFELTSSAFVDGASIPAEYTCSGDNISPPLAWSTPPEGTESLALLMDDPDAPTDEPFVHWVVVDIQPDETQMRSAQPVGMQGTNGGGTTGYLGPCPPEGDPHTYRFQLYALPTDAPTDGGSRPDVETIERLAPDALAVAELTGTFQRVAQD